MDHRTSIPALVHLFPKLGGKNRVTGNAIRRPETPTLLVNEFKRQVTGKKEDPADFFQTAAARVKVVLGAQVCGKIAL